MNQDGLLKMAQLSERSGVSPATIKHYLREGLLPEPVRTSRNMAYYPPDFVERIHLIKRLQEERFMPLKRIRDVLRERRPRTPREAIDLPGNVLDRLAEVGAVSSGEDGYDPDDVAVLDAIIRFRAGGFDESLGFTVYDTVRYREALEPLVRIEVEVLKERLAGKVSDERAAEIISAGAEPLRELIGALHSKLLRAELERA